MLKLKISPLVVIFAHKNPYNLGYGADKKMKKPGVPL
jgi:hypothetical protein